VNDENSLRTYGSRTDAYKVFRSMLDGGNPPDDWDELCKAASDKSAITRLAKAAPHIRVRSGGESSSPLAAQVSAPRRKSSPYSSAGRISGSFLRQRQRQLGGMIEAADSEGRCPLVLK
jgi:hypothetical protein